MKPVDNLIGLLSVMNSVGLLSAVFFAGKFTARLEALERNDGARQSQGSDIAVIKVNVENLKGQIEEIKKDIHDLRGDLAARGL